MTTPRVSLRAQHPAKPRRDPVRLNQRLLSYDTPLPIDDVRALIDCEQDKPVATGRDILVEVRAVSVNPVDVKIRASATPQGGPRILGWDAAGVVVEVGADVQWFKPGDCVYYAGEIDRPGSNAEFQLVDERIAAQKPNTLDFAQAAAMPLTAITAWEVLYDRLDVRKPVVGANNCILVIGSAGGVGSMAIQLARQEPGLTVIATASRPESIEWCRQLGAHHVLDHTKSLADQMEALNIGAPAYVFSTTHTGQHIKDIVQIIAPQGRFCLIDDPASLDVLPLKYKSVSLHWEFMFTRSLQKTADMAMQHEILARVASLVDGEAIRSTLKETLSPINAANLRLAHAKVETNHMIGKLVISGWS
ncbi:MAG: zinc-binding alcohol dehydrogenase family protein [Sulfuricellaceae bacterium]|nr:zinc-binding alcohol dehydrogenase family protein [Sulfuricellaceae bacterium]